MKARADMMRQLEGALVRVCGCVGELGDEMERPLPPSPQLEADQEEILKRQVGKNGLNCKLFCEEKVNSLLFIFPECVV